MDSVRRLNEKFCREEFDENGVLKKFELTPPQNFNFAYDVIDEIARLEPQKRALVWCNDKGQERIFTYSDFSELSNRTANMFLANGVKKGDMVMCVLKRHWQFWIVTFALCKIGAILIPATNQLMKKDYTYRFELGKVTHIIATADGEVIDHIEDALKEYDKMGTKFVVNANGVKKDGWIDFDEEIVKYDDKLPRFENDVNDDMLAFFSSGTTGYPKLVLHAHHYAVAHIITAKHWHHLNENSLHLTISESGWAKCAWGFSFIY